MAAECSLLDQPLGAVVVGPELFASALTAQSVPVSRVDWRPPEGADALASLWRDDVDAANRVAIDRVLAAHQILVDVRPAIDVVPGMTRDTVLHRMTPEQWNAVIQTNLTSCFNMCRVVIEGMRERGFGRIVNIGSINGQAGQYGQVNYAAAKSGIHGFTKALAQEGAGKGITVNAIAPGYIDTEMVRAVPEDVLKKIVARIPVGRLGHADEIARGVAFLASDEAAFITGSTMSINGGQHMY